MADRYFTDLPALPTPELFAVRLNEALAYRHGNLSDQEKIRFIAQAVGRTPRTVRAWLRGDNLPRRNRDIHILAEALGARYGWLHFGLGDSPLRADLLEKLQHIPKKYLPKLTRFALRLLNDDPKALRWVAMAERGELSAFQIMEMA